MTYICTQTSMCSSMSDSMAASNENVLVNVSVCESPKTGGENVAETYKNADTRTDSTAYTCTRTEMTEATSEGPIVFQMYDEDDAVLQVDETDICYELTRAVAFYSINDGDEPSTETTNDESSSTTTPLSDYAGNWWNECPVLMSKLQSKFDTYAREFTRILTILCEDGRRCLDLQSKFEKPKYQKKIQNKSKASLVGIKDSFNLHYHRGIEISQALKNEMKKLHALVHTRVWETSVPTPPEESLAPIQNELLQQWDIIHMFFPSQDSENVLQHMYTT